MGFISDGLGPQDMVTFLYSSFTFLVILCSHSQTQFQPATCKTITIQISKKDVKGRVKT